MFVVFVLLQVDVLFELIKGLIKDLEGDPEDEVDIINCF